MLLAPVLALLPAAALVPSVPLAMGPQDLAARYPATLEHVPDNPPAYGWVCTEEDVWSLGSFGFELEKRLGLKARASTLVLGRYGTDVLWAVVLPEKPFKLESTLGGGGEKVRSVWMRFHPARLGELFPARTVRGQGPEEARFEAYRIYSHKVSSLWSTRYEPADEGQPARDYFDGYRPVVPPRDELVLDMDTEEGPRRVFTIDLASGQARLRGAFLTQALARPHPVERRDALAAYERACAIGAGMQASGLEPAVASWDEHAKDARREFLRASTDLELARAVHVLLRPFEDPWLALRCGEDVLPAVRWDRRPLNASWGGVQDILGKVTTSAGGIRSGRTPYGIGYIRCTRAADASAVEEFDAALEELDDTWGLVLDLRFGLEGERERVEALAGRFVEEPTTYARLVLPSADGGGEELRELVLEPRGPWPYRGFVWALIGPRTTLEAEGLALAVLAFPKGATVGEPSSGLGLTAGWEELPAGLELFRRSGRTHDPEDRPLPPDGLLPTIPILPERSAFGDKADPVLYRALEAIYQVPHPERLQARNGAPFPWPGDPGKAEPAEGDSD